MAVILVEWRPELTEQDLHPQWDKIMVSGESCAKIESK